MSDKKNWWEFDTAMLHILAMVFMLSDHMWSTLFPNQIWMTFLGRIAFPIFAFMIAEGYFHTHDFRKYVLRMLLFALLSEIPFDLMYNGAVWYPYHQNVMWTFLLALLGMRTMDAVRSKGKKWLTIIAILVLIPAFSLLGLVCMMDYYAAGILTVFVFYFFRKRVWWCRLLQFAILYYLNVEVLGGQYYVVNVFGHSFEVMKQGFALLALIPIWLYRGRQGYHSRTFQYFCYAFYGLHMLLLVTIGYLTMQL